MDRIITAYVNDFNAIFERPSSSESEDFEHFANHTIVSSIFKGNFNYADIHTGNSTIGIDGIAFIVNGRLISDSTEISDLIDINGTLDVQIIFIQTKSSAKFDGSDMGNFIFATKSFFNNHDALFPNDEMKNFMDIFNEISNNYPKMTKHNPILHLFYVTTGRWHAEIPLRGIIENGEKELMDLDLFESVKFHPVDVAEIQKIYKKNKELSQASFIFKEKVTLPEINGVDEAYLGYLPWSEFKGLIMDETGAMKSIFEDNVRDYLGSNIVNNSIRETLNKKKHDLFTILNNGVTIVASKIKSSAHKFTISDYQIVNGCQTSHVLYENNAIINETQLHIPVRLIITADDDVKNEITIATNNQTAIKPEQLEALSEFQKRLEEYYKFANDDVQLFYERRSNQYNSNDSVIKSKIVSVSTQIKCFAAMFLDVPHIVSGYYGTIMRNKGADLFKQNHQLQPYYVSGLAHYVLESMFRDTTIARKYRKARFHMLMLFRILVLNNQIPSLESARISERQCKKLIDVLIDNKKAKKHFLKCASVIDSCNISTDDKTIFKQSETTKRLSEFLINELGS